MGSDESALDPTVDWIGPERTLVGEAVAAGTPVLGVCFGGQLLAQVLGGEVPGPPAGRSVGGPSSRPIRSRFPSGPWLVWHEDAFTAPPGRVPGLRPMSPSTRSSPGSTPACSSIPRSPGRSWATGWTSPGQRGHSTPARPGRFWPASTPADGDPTNRPHTCSTASSSGPAFPPDRTGPAGVMPTGRGADQERRGKVAAGPTDRPCPGAMPAVAPWPATWFAISTRTVEC